MEPKYSVNSVEGDSNHSKQQKLGKSGLTLVDTKDMIRRLGTCVKLRASILRMHEMNFLLVLINTVSSIEFITEQVHKKLHRSDIETVESYERLFQAISTKRVDSNNIGDSRINSDCRKSLLPHATNTSPIKKTTIISKHYIEIGNDDNMMSNAKRLISAASLAFREAFFLHAGRKFLVCLSRIVHFDICL